MDFASYKYQLSEIPHCFVPEDNAIIRKCQRMGHRKSSIQTKIFIAIQLSDIRLTAQYKGRRNEQNIPAGTVGQICHVQ